MGPRGSMAAPFYMVLPVGMQIYPLMLLIVALLFSSTSQLARLYVLLSVLLVALPLPPRPVPVTRFLSRLIATAVNWHSLQIICDEEKLGTGPFLIGLEPHSALPVLMPIVFNTLGKDLLPRAMQPCSTLATTAAFWVPASRHLWHWLDMRPATRSVIASCLSSGRSVCLNPGGIQECLLMEPGREVAFLKSRHGFVKAAMRAGVPLVPAFVFGQTESYTYYRPGPPWVSHSTLAWLSRRVGVVPMLLIGWKGTLVPKPVRMTVALGNPIHVPHVAEPSNEEAQVYLDAFIVEMERIALAHRAEAGLPDTELTVY